MNDHPPHTRAAEVFTALILEVFRLNGQLLAAGDRLVEVEGLTSARWQVMGAIDLADYPLSVAQIARRMGLSRQAVQRVANDLEASGYVCFQPNPDHLRAKHVALSKKGCAALERVKVLQVEWANALTSGLDASSVGEACTLLRDLQKRLAAKGDLKLQPSEGED